eukprot:CAMPEP_0181338156 /NCGR_PEP_ID=MMETSP1101-20121128/28479_1 /TAXON_ID=46948 /ORGANISM="Rhodomonas abbreviata, Strain Caron Lab Isolate" /LENGTH=62 /DNA_ID=CAMNT_0023448853 /DNA_START=51 /DNA_END=239 /DNA_ORIENTATION=+
MTKYKVGGPTNSFSPLWKDKVRGVQRLYALFFHLPLIAVVVLSLVFAIRYAPPHECTFYWDT